ncbi:MAG: hypothetical protein AAF399_01745 [Bacteroidota bacterium]
MSETPQADMPSLAPDELYAKYLAINETGFRGKLKFYAFAPLGLAVPINPKVKGAIYNLETGQPQGGGMMALAGHQLNLREQDAIFKGSHNGERETYLSEFWGKNIPLQITDSDGAREIDTVLYSPALLTNVAIQSAEGELPADARVHAAVISEGTVLT